MSARLSEAERDDVATYDRVGVAAKPHRAGFGGHANRFGEAAPAEQLQIARARRRSSMREIRFTGEPVT